MFTHFAIIFCLAVFTDVLCFAYIAIVCLVTHPNHATIDTDIALKQLLIHPRTSETNILMVHSLQARTQARIPPKHRDHTHYNHRLICFRDCKRGKLRIDNKYHKSTSKNFHLQWKKSPVILLHKQHSQIQRGTPKWQNLQISTQFMHVQRIQLCLEKVKRIFIIFRPVFGG